MKCWKLWDKGKHSVNDNVLPLGHLSFWTKTNHLPGGFSTNWIKNFLISFKIIWSHYLLFPPSRQTARLQAPFCLLIWHRCVYLYLCWHLFCFSGYIFITNREIIPISYPHHYIAQKLLHHQTIVSSLPYIKHSLCNHDVFCLIKQNVQRNIELFKFLFWLCFRSWVWWNHARAWLEITTEMQNSSRQLR